MSCAELRLKASIVANHRVEFSGGGAEIRAAVLGGILLDRTKRPRKLCLSDVRIVGALDLEAGEVGFPVRFDRCEFSEPPNLEQASVCALYFVRCKLPGLSASQVRVDGNLALRQCETSGRVELTGGYVQGQLDLSGSHIHNTGDEAITADGLRVKQDVFWSDGFSARGLTRMLGAFIGGQFICDGASFRNPGSERALELSGLIVEEHTLWRKRFTVEGRVCLRGARIKGRLDCSGAIFRNPGLVALEAVGLHVTQEAKFADGCKVKGEVNLTGCQIGGWLDFTKGEFSNAGLKALDLARASIAQNLIFRSGFSMKGKVLLANAKIGGSIWCEGGRFENETDTAIDATGIQVEQNVLLSEDTTSGERFLAKGNVVFSDATIGGNLDCTGGQLVNSQHDALTAEGISVTREALFRDGFTADGRVDLVGAKVGGLNFNRARLVGRGEALRCDRAKVRQSALFNGFRAEGAVHIHDAEIGADLHFGGAVLEDGAFALVIKGSDIKGSLRIHLAEHPAGLIDLYRVRAATFDDRKSRWPANVRLNDFVYDALRDGKGDVTARIKWLRQNHDYAPQIYLQLASTYTKQGLHDLATRVLMAGEDARRRARTGFLGNVYRIFWWFLKPTVGYGYKPFRILWWLLVLQLAGWLTFEWLGDDQFVPVRPGESRFGFNAFLYTADLLLPVVSIRHRDLWVPQGGAVAFAVTFTVMGWILAICLVTGVGRLFKRET